LEFGEIARPVESMKYHSCTQQSFWMC